MLIILTLVSITVAILTSVVAWRTTRAERLRSAARVEALARDIHGLPPIDELPLRTHSVSAVEPAASGDLFVTTATATAPSGARWGLAIAVGAFVVASMAALIVVLGGDDTPAQPIAQRPTPEAVTVQRTAVATRTDLPLELVTLSHERSGNQLTVKGIVRNPAAGAERDRLTAVVVLLNDAGSVVTTSRGAVAAQALIPGGESTFAVTVPDAGDVARYRVSFRSDERVVAHVDKRTGP